MGACFSLWHLTYYIDYPLCIHPNIHCGCHGNKFIPGGVGDGIRVQFGPKDGYLANVTGILHSLQRNSFLARIYNIQETAKLMY